VADVGLHRATGGGGGRRRAVVLRLWCIRHRCTSRGGSWLPPSQPASWWLCAFDFYGESHVTTLSEVPLLLGLVFASPGHLLLATLLGTAVGAIGRRQRPVKATFNVTTRLLETSVAALCFHAVIGHRDPLSTIGWLAPFVAIPVATWSPPSVSRW